MRNVNRPDREFGVAVVELALALPFMVVFLVVVLFYGYAYLLVRTSESAVSVGAQAATAESPLEQKGAYSPDLAAVAAAKMAIGGGFESIKTDSGASECIAPLKPSVASDFVFAVKVQFSSCKFLERLRIRLPLVGKLPPDLGDYTATARVQL